MPYKPLSPCKHTGCNRVCEGNYCEIHKRLHPKTRSSASIGYQKLYTQRWKDTASRYLREHPFCKMCGGVATVVDHIKPHKGDRTLFWNYSNWQPLCERCHNKKTVLFDGGFGNKVREEK